MSGRGKGGKVVKLAYFRIPQCLRFSTGTRKGWCKETQEDFAWQHPGYHETCQSPCFNYPFSQNLTCIYTGYSSSRPSWRCQTYLGPDLWGNPWSFEDLPWKCHSGFCHIYRTCQTVCYFFALGSAVPWWFNLLPTTVKQSRHLMLFMPSSVLVVPCMVLVLSGLTLFLFLDFYCTFNLPYLWHMYPNLWIEGE